MAEYVENSSGNHFTHMRNHISGARAVPGPDSLEAISTLLPRDS